MRPTEAWPMGGIGRNRTFAVVADAVPLLTALATHPPRSTRSAQSIYDCYRPRGPILVVSMQHTTRTRGEVEAASH